MFYRVFSLVRKEMQALLQDRQGRMLLIVPVLLQLAVFPFAATLEVKNNTLALFNEDAGPESVELAHRFSQAKAFTTILYVHNEQDLRSVLDNQRALILLRFPVDFSRELAGNRPVKLQAILDGRRSNSGQIAFGYVQQILQQYLDEREHLLNHKIISQILVRHWFNPLRHFIVIVKGLFIKNISYRMLFQSVWPMIVIATLTLSAANWMFRKRIG